MTTDERMEKMEGQLVRVRWFNRCLIGCIVLSLGVWFILKTFGPETAWAQSGTKEIRANKFVLEDENGKERASLSVHQDGPRLTLMDDNGKPRVSLLVLKGAPGLMLYDENGQTCAALSVLGRAPGLRLYDESGKPRVQLELVEDKPGLLLKDENGKTIWGTP